MKKSGNQAPKKSAGVWKAEDYISTGVPLTEINEIKEAFDLFDTDLGGSIDTKCIDLFLVQS